MKKGTKLQEMILGKSNSIFKHLGAKMYNHGILQIALELEGSLEGNTSCKRSICTQTNF